MAGTAHLAAEAIRELDRRAGDAAGRGTGRWRLIGALHGGHQSGAWRVVGPDGVPGVLKVATTAGWSDQVSRADAAVAAVRRRGYPTPAWSTEGTTASGLAFRVQELVRGAPVAVVDAARARTFVDLIERQAGLDPDPARNWSDFVVDQLSAHRDELGAATLAVGEEGRRLLAVCTPPADGARDASWPRRDMVHGDLRPGNVLFDGDVIAGVVDIEAIGSGTRTFDYATLLSHDAIDDAAVAALVDAATASSDAVVFRACLAFVMLDLLRFTAGDPVEQRRELAGRLLRRAELIDRILST